METKQIPMSDLRVAKGISQKKFAQEINVSPGLIGMYETGKRKPSLKKALMIAKYFDVPVESILFGKYDFCCSPFFLTSDYSGCLSQNYPI